MAWHGIWHLAWPFKTYSHPPVSPRVAGINLTMFLRTAVRMSLRILVLIARMIHADDDDDDGDDDGSVDEHSWLWRRR